MSSSFDEIQRHRLEKLEYIRKRNIDPYPERIEFERIEIAKIHKNFRKFARSNKTIGIVGRIMARREHGKSTFLDIVDGSGKLQIFCGFDHLGGDAYKDIVNLTDIGDFIAIRGKPFFTKQKEPTLEVLRWQMLSKSLRPLPEKWHGISDVEERFRKRYLDLLMNEEVHNRFLMRSKIISEIRSFFHKQNYQEVETPLLHAIPGGALARPFVTHHNALDQDFYLRIAPELYLKRLLIGGIPKVFELGRNFRNEGIDHTHNPEFTMLESYAAYETREDLIKLTHALFQTLAKTLFKSTNFEFQGNSINFKQYKILSFSDAMERYATIPFYDRKTREDILVAAQRFGVSVDAGDTKSKIADLIFKKVVRPKLIQPAFLVDHPLEISPLAKKNPKNPETTLRFQYIVGGVELVNGFSELNDPLDQAERFRAQEKIKAQGEGEAMSYDEDFVEALEYGMPPAAGLGIGIDRLVMLFTNTDNIKEVILFPTLRAK